MEEPNCRRYYYALAPTVRGPLPIQELWFFRLPSTRWRGHFVVTMSSASVFLSSCPHLAWSSCPPLGPVETLRSKGSDKGRLASLGRP